LHAGVAFETNHQRFAGALTVRVTGNRSIRLSERTLWIAATTSALRIAKVTHGAGVAVSARITLTALALSIAGGTLLTNGADVITLAFPATPACLPAPGARNTLSTSQAAGELGADTAAIVRIAHLTL